MNVNPAQILPEGRTPTSSAVDFALRYWREILLSFVGWTLLAAIPTTSAYIGMNSPGIAVWWAVFQKIGLYYYLWGLLTPLLYRLSDKLPYRGAGLMLTAVVHIGVFVVISFTLGVISHQADWRDWLLGDRAIGFHSMGAFTYALIILCCMAIKFYRMSLLQKREASNARIHAAELDSKLNLARVDSLRMQMNPHFLFNALNSVAALIDSDKKDRAYEALERLGDLLRQALRISRTSEVTLDDELQFSKAYLALEKIRFGERLNVNWEIDADTRALYLPAFILQPLIENSIKHSVSASSNPVTITVFTGIDGANLVLEISDDGRKSSALNQEASPGIGISNLRERLQLRFGGAVSVVHGFKQRGFRAVITISMLKLSTVPSD